MAIQDGMAKHNVDPFLLHGEIYRAYETAVLEVLAEFFPSKDLVRLTDKVEDIPEYQQ